MPVFDPVVAEYRYFVADFLTNVVIAELPFKGVSYERALNGAGAFSGSIPVIEATASYSLYESTMPGKTSLYVVRNNECVWGGIIWSRSYSLTNRELSVNATEFTSYLHHRNVWKTIKYVYSATGVVNTATLPNILTVTLSSGDSYPFSANMPLGIKFTDAAANSAYGGVKTILGTRPISSTSFAVGVAGIPTGTYGVIVTVQVDTYDYIRNLLTQALDDFSQLSFANEEIEPALRSIDTVTQVQLTDNYATLTASSHSVIPGQTIDVDHINATFNGRYEVTSTTPTTVTYYKAAGNVAPTAVSPSVLTVSRKSASSATDPDTTMTVGTLYARLRTTTAHGLSIGDVVTISGVDASGATTFIFNGTYRVASVPTTTDFTYFPGVATRVDAVASGGSVSKVPSIVYGTYGAFPGNADFDLDFSTSAYSGEVHLEDNIVRGFQLKSVGEILDEYSDTLNGFEYRIDCSYDTATSSFKRTFVFVPIDVPDPTPPALKGDAQNLVFEYPGNIMEVEVEESAENAATRFFVVGNDGTLGADASQPYAVASATDFLTQGWPLLDADEAKTDVFDENVLYQHANRYLSEFQPPVSDVSVSVNGSLYPTVGSYNPGDWCALIINDQFVLERLATNLEPRSDLLVRKIDSFSVSVPDNPSFPEKVSLKLLIEGNEA